MTDDMVRDGDAIKFASGKFHVARGSKVTYCWTAFQWYDIREKRSSDDLRSPQICPKCSRNRGSDS